MRREARAALLFVRPCRGGTAAGPEATQAGVGPTKAGIGFSIAAVEISIPAFENPIPGVEKPIAGVGWQSVGALRTSPVPACRKPTLRRVSRRWPPRW